MFYRATTLESGPTIEELERRFPKGGIVRGVVERHVSFGFFVDLGVPGTVGLVRIIDITDEPPVTESDYPAVGTEVNAYVWGVEPGGGPWHQVTLCIRPSVLQGAV